MTGVPRVSVVMSVFNGAGRLRETVDSVLAQEESDFEFVIVNDGSTDPDVARTFDRFARQDSRIRLFPQPNLGITRALMRGCEAARGAYVARVDVGDVMLPDRLGAQSDVLDRWPDCAFVSCWTEFCGPEWERLFVRQGEPTPGRPVPVLPARPGGNLQSGPTHHGSVTFRASAYRAAGGYRPDFYYGQDWDLWYRLAERGDFHLIGRVLYRVRVLPEGISAGNARRQRAIGRYSRGALACRMRGEDEASWLARARRIRPRRAGNVSRFRHAAGLYFISACLFRNRDPRFGKYLAAALKANPLLARAWWLAAKAARSRLASGVPRRRGRS